MSKNRLLSIYNNFHLEYIENMKNDEGNYVVKSVIGQGGVGRVFLAFDKNIRRNVAIKEPRTDNPGVSKEKLLARFSREAKITGQLEHPNIIPIYELNRSSEGTEYYVMRYVKGKTLYQAVKDRIGANKDGAFRSRMELLNNFIDVCDAMSFAHAKGVIHRDLKPGNIIIGDYGETVILDWGIAKRYKNDDTGDGDIVDVSLIEDDSEDMKTGENEVLGTPSYMAPEQIDKKFGSVDPQTDVYSLGVLLFMLLTGERPYHEKGKNVMSFVVSDAPSPDPSERYSSIPPELVAICKKAMAKEKKGRFKDASEMTMELKSYHAGRLVSIYNYSRFELFKRFVAKNKLALAVFGLLVVSIIVGAGFAMNFAHTAHKAELKAQGALVDVMNLSEEAFDLVQNEATTLNKDTVNIYNDMLSAVKEPSTINSAIINLKEKYSFVDGFIFKSTAEAKNDFQGIIKNEAGRYLFMIHVPFNKQYFLAAMIDIGRFVLSMLPFDPLKSPYQIWCMKDDGLILYDKDPKQTGKYLFTDEMYASYPELLKFGKKMMDQGSGVGYYSFFKKEGGPVIYKVAAWDTIKGADEDDRFKIIVTHPYVSAK